MTIITVITSTQILEHQNLALEHYKNWHKNTKGKENLTLGTILFNCLLFNVENVTACSTKFAGFLYTTKKPFVNFKV